MKNSQFIINFDPTVYTDTYITTIFTIIELNKQRLWLCVWTLSQRISLTDKLETALLYIANKIIVTKDEGFLDEQGIC